MIAAGVGAGAGATVVVVRRKGGIIIIIITIITIIIFFWRPQPTNENPANPRLLSISPPPSTLSFECLERGTN